jgi:hypothetical protein
MGTCCVDRSIVETIMHKARTIRGRESQVN